MLEHLTNPRALQISSKRDSFKWKLYRLNGHIKPAESEKALY